MNLTELRSRTIKRRDELEERLKKQYESLYIHDVLSFRKKDGGIFDLCAFPDDGAVFIEYAENYDEAMLYRLEDGDLFYLEDMDEETMFQAMIDEIEQ